MAAPTKGTGRGGRIGMALFFGVFLAFGVGFLIPLFLHPAARMIAARGWSAAQCEILTSGVGESSGDDGSTYRVEVTYRYQADGRILEGSRYKFVPGSSSGRAGKEAIVRRLAPGTHTPCWVNPNDATDAVIERGPTADMWFALIPMVFVLIGAVGMGFSLFASRHPMSAAISSVPRRVSTAIPAAVMPGPLKPTATRRAQAIAMVVITLSWNGIISAFLVPLVTEARSGSVQWGMVAFLTPFVAVGLGLVVGTVYKFMQLSNPRTDLTIESARVALGEELRIAWVTSGRIEKMRSFSIVLEGREVARYRRGTDHVTDKHVFATIPLVTQAIPAISDAGRAEMVFPEDAMHTFVSDNNKVVWVLKVTGEIQGWPDMADEFPLEVAPRRR